MLNKNGDKTDPCLTPKLVPNICDHAPFRFTQAKQPESQFLKKQVPQQEYVFSLTSSTSRNYLLCRMLWRDCVKSVWFNRYCTGTERKPCDNCLTAEAVRISYDCKIWVLFFGNKSPKIVCLRQDHSAASEGCLCGDGAMPATICLRATGLRFKRKSV